LYASADVFVHPNPREPFGIAPLEAIASGTLVVAPRSGGILSYLDDDNAWLTNPSPEAFATAIQAALENDSERTRRCENARKTAEAMSWKRVTRMWFDLYDEVHRARRFREAQAADEPNEDKRIA
jgi:glycosyltransferase involved in cell wall biosynthesis